MERVIVGLFAAALWLPILTLFSWPGGAVLVGALTIPLTLLVAAPLVYLFRRRLSLWLCLAAGATVGAIGAATFTWLTNPLAGANSAPALIGVGAISGGVFWLAGVFRNPYFAEVKGAHSDAT